jgi:hypothetical protein
MARPAKDWRTQALEAARSAAREHKFWRDYLDSGRATDDTDFSVHLGIFTQPYLDFVLDGRKTVESRFSSVRCAPYDRVVKGDVLLVKATGGPIVGICLIDRVWSYCLDPTSWEFVRRSFTAQLCAQDPEFWRARKHASFATLMRISQVTAIDAVSCDKRDRRGWVVLRSRLGDACVAV